MYFKKKDLNSVTDMIGIKVGVYSIATAWLAELLIMIPTRPVDGVTEISSSPGHMSHRWFERSSGN